MKLTKSVNTNITAKYGEWQASLFGACFIAFGLGVLLSRYFDNFIWVVILIGILLHGWGMSKVYKMNK